MNQRIESEQAKYNALKVIRAAIRLKHSIAADNEINAVLPEAEKVFNRRAQQGQIMSPAEVKKAVGV